MSCNCPNRYYGGFPNPLNYMNYAVPNVVQWVHMGISLLTLILIIVIVVRVNKEGFRGIFYKPGQMIRPDIPATFKVGDQEVDNPAYTNFSKTWERGSDSVYDHPVWTMK